MEYTNKFQNPCQIEAKRLLFVVGIVAVTHLLCQSLILPYGDALLSLVHDYEIPTRSKDSIAARDSSTKSVMVSDSILVHASERTDTSMFVGVVKDAGNSNSEDEIRHDNGPNVAERYINNEFASDVRDPKNVVDVVEKGNLYNDSQSERDMEKSSALEEIVKNQDNVSILEKVNETRDGFFLEQIVKSNHNISEEIILEADPSLTSNQFGKMMTAFESPPLGLALETPLINTTSLKNSTTERTSISSAPHFRFYVGEQAKVLAPGENENLALVENDLDTPNNNTAQSNSSKKKMRCPMPPKSITSIHEMNRILVRNRITSRSMRPRWSSARDREILAAKLQIVNACTEKNDGELYAPLFRNVSMFRR
ncbi:uncharacterized protein LOC131158202 [Malania oleifera]|uniref:uncharacterized protein LOC131158202 n=1 Tax=Malania oleifera TaxID=397392 RepID=UPI0025AE78C9|nr:uncharacterized protein LOC131158202 [Malania oleifera]